MAQQRKYYPFLDGFRGVAIIMIVIHHIRHGFNLDHLFVTDPPVMKWIYFKALEWGVDLTAFYLWLQYRIVRIKGVLGVEIFLVISGFLIARMLLSAANASDKGWISRFYCRRFFKIMPSYWLLVAAGILIFSWQNYTSLGEILGTVVHYVFFIQNYFPRHPFLDQTWTMVLIEQFYLFCPLVIALVYAKITAPRRREQILIGLCFLILVISPWIRVHCVSTNQDLLSWPVQAPNPHRTTLYNLDPIAFGCLLALLEPYWSQWRKSRRWGYLFWLGGLTAYYILYIIIDWSYFWGNWYLYTLGYLAVGCLFLAAHHGVSFFTHRKSLQWLGRHSYGIYLWHYLLLTFWKNGLGKIPLTVLIVTYFIASVALGVLSTQTIERYFLSLREKWIPAKAL